MNIWKKQKNIWINFEWLGSKTWLSIKDDGFGMNDPELIQAMRPGSKNPLQVFYVGLFINDDHDLQQSLGEPENRNG